MRAISENLEKFLQSDELKPLMNKIKVDSTLDFEIREDKCEIYYRGAEIFSIAEKDNKFYFTKQPNHYIKSEDELITPATIFQYICVEIPKRKDIFDCIWK